MIKNKNRQLLEIKDFIEEILKWTEELEDKIAEMFPQSGIQKNRWKEKR